MKIINRLGFIIVVVCIMMLTLACTSQVMTQEEDQIYTYTSSPSDQDNNSYAQFSIWCPEKIENYKGILYLGAGYEHSSIPMMDEEKWQNLARENEFVILTSDMKSRTEKDFGISYWQAEYGSGQAMINALKHFAEVSNHPEVEDVPLAMWGFSAGGQFTIILLAGSQRELSHM